MDIPQSIPMDESTLLSFDSNNNNNNNHGWQKVSYAKRQRKPTATAAPVPGDDRPRSNGLQDRSNVFASVEQKAAERRRALESAAAAAAAAEVGIAVRSRARTSSDDEYDEDEVPHGGQENAGEAPKKVKEKKPKKPKITVAEAAAGIDAADLAAYLVDISGSYESQQDIQLMRFADYFGRSFASVGAAQFPWAKMFKESPVSKIVD